MNKVMIIGHLGRDPEMRYTPSGRPMTRFSVATSRNWTTTDGDRRSETEWFNVVTWGRLAEICNQYLNKGHQVYIEGRLQTRRWEDQEGNRKSTIEVVASKMLMLGERSNNHKHEDQEFTEFSTEESEVETPIEDEFPF